MSDMQHKTHNYFGKIIETLNRFDKSSIENFVELVMQTYHNQGTIYAFGNGGSAATASHFCGDLMKGVSYGLEKRLKAVCLTDNTPSLMAIANDISYDDIFLEQLKGFLRKGDLVIAFSGSGNSPNVVRAIEYANASGAKTVAFCGYKGGKIKDIAHLSLHADIEDMEAAEDVHLILTHTIKKILMEEVRKKPYPG